MGAPGLPFAVADLADTLAEGLRAFAVPPPISLPRWADENFYLSAESSYVEQAWRPWSFQTAILACMGYDDIEEVDVKKSARVGYTKLLLAYTGYLLHHKRRNVAVWQPTDEDRDQFTKTELEPMLRDVACMRDVFPNFLAKNKSNTLKQKMLLGCTIHTLGGKAAKNYRRISVDAGILDEISGFDLNIENEGAPFGLAAKRVEGASFPKMICGSTPKLKGFCQIEARVVVAQHVFRRHVPCPNCGEMHPLTWGGRDAKHGMKWQKGATDEETAATIEQLCPHCGVQYSQADFISVEAQGEWRTDTGIRLLVDAEGYPVFLSPSGERIATPRHVAFDDLWSAYSPNVSWVAILREYLAAVAKARKGDSSDLQTFTNTTLGQTWMEEGEKTESSTLSGRAEDYALRTVPHGGLILVAFVDVQDNRFEIVTQARGRGDETWIVDYTVLEANPAVESDWDKLDEYLLSTFRHDSGQLLKIEAAGIDTGGHFTHQVYNFCRTRERRRIFATKGESRDGKPVKSTSSMQDVNWRGKILKRGVKLHYIGTDTAKDLIFGRLKVTQYGPGYMHFSKGLPAEFYDQLTAEQRVLVKTSTGEKYRWVKVRTRNEALDCVVGCEFAAQALDLHRYTDRMWAKLETAVQPATADLFDSPPLAPPAKVIESLVPIVHEVPRRVTNTAIGSGEWSSRL